MKTLTRGLTALLLALLIGVAQAEDKKDDKGKNQPEKKKADKPVVPDFPDIDKLFEQFSGLPDEQLKEMAERMKAMREMVLQMQKQGALPGGGGFGGFRVVPIIPNAPVAGRRELPQEARLGAKLSEPSATLIDQLDLPKDHGLVVEDLTSDSPAAKVGLKANDILLEIGSKSVPTKRDEFEKVLASVEAGKEVDLVVMRKGKKETLKGLKLPEVKAAQPATAPRRPGFGGGFGNFGGFGGSTSIVRTNDDFTTTHTAGGVTIVVTGKVANGKAEVSEIKVTDGDDTKTYASLDKVPETHQATVKKVIEMSGNDGVLRLRRR